MALYDKHVDHAARFDRADRVVVAVDGRLHDLLVGVAEGDLVVVAIEDEGLGSGLLQLERTIVLIHDWVGPGALSLLLLLATSVLLPLLL